MKIKHVQLKLNTLEKLVRFYIFTLVFLTINGCVEQTVKVIFVPVSSGGGGWLLLFFIVVGISAIFDPYKPPTPEQIQQQNAAVQKREDEKRRVEAMDLPAGLTPTSSNFAYANEIISTAIVVKSQTLSLDHVFHVYSKDSSYQNSEWQSSEIFNVVIQNPDNPERRLFFNLKNNVAGWKIIVTWDENKGLITTKHPEQSQESSAENPSVENSPSVNYTPPQSSYQQHQNKNIAKDVDPSGL